jgi:soluble lytic murein transglycosylase-like protein
MYEVLAKSPSSDPVLRWHHFWNLYLGGEYQNALALLDRGGYVPHRDRGIDGGLDYWRARVLEKLGRDKEADEILRRIVTESGSSYYAMMIQARRPKLVESTAAGIFGTSDQLKEASGPESPTNSNANENPDVSEESSESASPGDYKITVAMRKWGLFQYGRRLHRTLPIKPQPTANGGLESFKLAFDLQDYSYGLKSLSLPGSPLKKIPTSRTQIEQHISKYNSDWRTLYPFAFKDIVESMAKAADVDPFLIVSLMRAESVYDQDARSLVGARGLMQIMPFTGVRIARTMGDGVFAVSDLHSPEVNIGYGAYYIKKLINYYRGSEILAVAAYNGGPGAVDRWLGVYQNLEMDEFVESIPFRETRRYVKSVFRNFDNYKRIWQQSKALSALPELPRSTTGGEIF